MKSYGVTIQIKATDRAPNVRESNPDSGFHALDSRFQVLDSGFFACRTLESEFLSLVVAAFRIPQEKFPGFPILLHEEILSRTFLWYS